MPDSQLCRLLTFLQMLCGSLWCKKLRVLYLIPDNGPTHAPKQSAKWIRSPGLALPGQDPLAADQCVLARSGRDRVILRSTHLLHPRDFQDTDEIEVKTTVGKTPLKSGRRKQPRIIAQFLVEFRFKADGGNFQIVQGITSNLREEAVSCRLREPIPATDSYTYLPVTDQKHCAVSGRIIWTNNLDNECGVRVENATTDWKQFILATLNDARTSLSSDRPTLNRL